MALFGSRTPATASELIGRKRYREAVELLRAQIASEGNSAPLRMQLADVLVLAGRGEEAVPVLVGLADEFAREGLVARAMALLKKVQRLAPGRSDVEARLATFVPELEPSPIRRAPPRRGGSETYEPNSVPERRATDVPPAPPPPPPVPSIEDERAAAVNLRAELLDGAPDILDNLPPRRDRRRRVRTPLFSSLSEPELVGLFRALRLLTFEAGDLIIHQGDEGDRMFVVTSGRGKVFVKEPGGRRRILVRVVEEGDFFGELSLLRNEPRAETVVAASALELLELERSMLETLCQTYPRVRSVLEDFSQELLLAQQEALSRRERHGTAKVASD